MDLFPNTLFALFTLSAERYIPLTSPGIKVKGEKVKGCRHYIKSKKQIMQYTYPFIGMC